MYLENPEARIKNIQTIKNFIINERESRGISANKLATLMSRPQPWIAQIENGRTKTIKHSDFVAMFASILSVSPEKADIYLEENQVKYKTDKNTVEFNDEIPDKQLNLFQIEEDKSEDIEKLQEEYKHIIDNIYEGFEFFFKKVNNKQDAIKTLNLFRRNLHMDMGFTFSVASLPLCRLKKIDSNLKHEVFKSFYKLIDDAGIKCNGKNCDCEDDEKSKE